MSGFRFESSAALFWLWMLPVLYIIYRVLRRHTQKKLSAKLNDKLSPFLTASVSDSKRTLKLRLELLVLGLMIFAYARPQTSEGRQQVKNEGIEILLMVDVSNSMLAEDIRPSRLALAKSELMRFVDLSSGDRLGLVAFAGSAVLLSPMTNDHDALKMYIDSLDPSAVTTQGTDFSKALNEAREAFLRGGLGEQEGSQVTRAVVIASDGEDLEPGAKDEVQKMIQAGIYIFTIGFGTEQGGVIPIKDDQGILRGYKRGSDNQVIMTKTQGTVLKDLAREGKGSFHHATFQGDAIQAVRKDIEELKKTQFESGEIRSYGEEFQPILLLALLLALIEMWLGDRKSKGRIWKGRFEVVCD